MSFPTRHRPILTLLLTALTPIIWGTTYLVTTEYLPADRPLITAVIRTLPAGLVLILLTRSFRPAIRWVRLLILSFLNIGAFQALLFVAAYRLPGGIAAIFGALQPVIVLSLAWGFERDQPRPITLATALAGVGGMALLFFSPGQEWDGYGITAAVFGTLSMAVGTFLSRRWREAMPLLGFTGWQLALGGLALVPFALVLEPPLPPLTLSNTLAFGYLSLVGTLLAYSLWFRGLAQLSPVAVSALGLLSPVTALILGWTILGEALGLREIAGVVLVLASLAALQVTLKPRRRSPLHPKPAAQI